MYKQKLQYLNHRSQNQCFECSDILSYNHFKRNTNTSNQKQFKLIYINRIHHLYIVKQFIEDKYQYQVLTGLGNYLMLRQTIFMLGVTLIVYFYFFSVVTLMFCKLLWNESSHLWIQNPVIVRMTAELRISSNNYHG